MKNLLLFPFNIHDADAVVIGCVVTVSGKGCVRTACRGNSNVYRLVTSGGNRKLYVFGFQILQKFIVYTSVSITFDLCLHDWHF